MYLCGRNRRQAKPPHLSEFTIVSCRSNWRRWESNAVSPTHRTRPILLWHHWGKAFQLCCLRDAIIDSTTARNALEVNKTKMHLVMWNYFSLTIFSVSCLSCVYVTHCLESLTEGLHRLVKETHGIIIFYIRLHPSSVIWLPGVWWPEGQAEDRKANYLCVCFLFFFLNQISTGRKRSPVANWPKKY